MASGDCHRPADAQVRMSLKLDFSDVRWALSARHSPRASRRQEDRVGRPRLGGSHAKQPFRVAAERAPACAPLHRDAPGDGNRGDGVREGARVRWPTREPGVLAVWGPLAQSARPRPRGRCTLRVAVCPVQSKATGLGTSQGGSESRASGSRTADSGRRDPHAVLRARPGLVLTRPLALV